MTTAKSDITTLKSDRTTANTNIATLNSDMTTAKADITTLKSDMTTANSNITTLQNNMTTANGNITTLGSNYTTILNQANATNTTVGSLITTVNGHTTSINTNTGDIADIKVKNTNQDNAIAALPTFTTADARYMRAGIQDISYLATGTAAYSMGGNSLMGLSNPINATDAANKNYVDTTLAAKTLDSFGLPTADISMNSRKLTNLAAPTVNTDAATKTYVDTSIASSTTNVSSLQTQINNLTLSNLGVPTGSVNMNNKTLVNLATPTLSTDAASKGYVDTKTLNSWAAPTANISMNNYSITGLADPVGLQDAATKNYVNNNINWMQTTCLSFGEIPLTPTAYLPARVRGSNFFGFGTSVECVAWNNFGTAVYVWKITVPDQGFLLMPMVSRVIQNEAASEFGQTATTVPFPFFIQSIPTLNSGGYAQSLASATDNRTTFLLLVHDNKQTVPTYDVQILWVKRPTT